MVTKPPRGLSAGQSAPNSDLFPFFDIIGDISKQWNEAEAAIKRCEQIAGDVSTPAIKELRYGGRRLIDALELAHQGAEQKDIEAYLEDARFCCYRAQHDAVDASFSKITIDLDNMTSKLGMEAVLKAYPEFREFYADFTVARQRIVESRRDRKKRAEIYEDLAAVDLDNLAERYERLMAVKPLAKRARIQMFLGGIWGIVIGFAAIAGAIFAGLAVDWSKYLGTPSTIEAVKENVE